jgi:2-isopropylmalate synthase
LTYEIMTPASVGVPSNSMVLGKHSGRRALGHRLKELGHPLDATQLDEFYHRFVELADRKKAVYDQDLVALATQTAAATSLAQA